MNINEQNRNEWIQKQLEQLRPQSSILDAGAGELRWKSACSHLQYVSQDFCQYDGNGNEKGLQMENGWDTSHIDIVSDIIDIPVEDESFDNILCTEVLEHLACPELAIKEFQRILKPGGVLLLTAPFCSLTHMAPYHFCTGFNRYWYEEILEKYGYIVEEIEYNGNYYSYMIQELHRIPYILREYSGKKSVIINILCNFLASCLKKYDDKHNSSNEILCFGLHVRAIKK